MTRRQVTVRDWDAEHGGTAFTDDGAVVPIPREALQGSVFRLLRPGQRIVLVDEDGRVTGVDLV